MPASYDQVGSKAASRAVHGERLGSRSLRYVLEREMPRTVRWLDQQLATPRTADPVAGLSSVRNKRPERTRSRRLGSVTAAKNYSALRRRASLRVTANVLRARS